MTPPIKRECLPMARKVLEFARAEHDDFTFDMGNWYVSNGCGTSACLAGTAAHLSPEVTLEKVGRTILRPMLRLEDGTEMWSVGMIGKTVLGLSEDVCDEDGDPTIFYTSNKSALRELEEYIKESEDFYAEQGE